MTPPNTCSPYPGILLDHRTEAVKKRLDWPQKGARSARKNVLQNSNGSSSSAGKPNPSVFAPRCGGHASGNFDTTIHQNHAFAMNYDDFFKAARGDESAPFDFQRRLACGERASRDEAAWLASGTEFAEPHRFAAARLVPLLISSNSSRHFVDEVSARMPTSEEAEL